MPDTQPSPQAMEAARKLLAIFRSSETVGDAEGLTFGSDAERRIIAVLESYAAERVAETHDNFRGTVTAMAAERDAAIARAEAAEAEVARWKVQFESTNAAGIGVVEKLAVAEERLRVLETTLNMIAESVIVSVAASPTEHRVTWGCGICQGEYHKSDRQEWYDHEAWYDHGAWCPRAKAADRQQGHDDPR